MCGLLYWFSTAAFSFLSQLVRSAKARLKTLDAEADQSTLLSSCDVMPSSSQEVR